MREILLYTALMTGAAIIIILIGFALMAIALTNGR